MARIITGTGISSIKGKIGGTIYSGSSSGTIAKNAPQVRKYTSQQASQAKSIMSLLQSAWSNLSAADKLLWADYALFKPVQQKNNPSRFLNGQQIFIKYNYAYYSQFLAIISTPVFDATPAPTPTLVIYNLLGALYVGADFAIDEANEFVIFKISSQMKQGRKMPPGGTKQIILTFANTSTVDISTDYLALYGQLLTANNFVQITYQCFNVANPNWSYEVTQVVEVS